MKTTLKNEDDLKNLDELKNEDDLTMKMRDHLPYVYDCSLQPSPVD